MAQCELTEKCIFFNDKMANMPAMADIYKQRYCGTDSSLCARYRVFEVLGRENVPADLYPNDAEGATRILAQ
jgi:hypothetical protein